MQQLEVLQQKMENWCAASIRALADEPSVDYRGHRLYVKGRPFPIRAPYLHLDFSTPNTAELRGVADGLALRLRHSDLELHRQLCPDNILELFIFDLLEQIRTESLVPETLPGARVNLRNRFLYWADQASASMMIENHAGALVFGLALTCWSRLMDEPFPEQLENLIESTRMGMTRKIGMYLPELKKHRNDQLAFSQPALEIAAIIQKMIGDLPKTNNPQSDIATFEVLIGNSQVAMQWLNTASEFPGQDSIADTASENAPSEMVSDYRVFSRDYDRQVNISGSVRPAELKKLRARLDNVLEQQNINVHRLARYLQQLFARPKLSGWSFGEEEGYLDSSRLSRLLTNPDDRRLFRKEEGKPFADCVVTILIDNSGSMRRHKLEIASLVDTFSRALELATVKTEILGFTTGAWTGGRAYKNWIAKGRPANPGRMNEIRHTVYKDAETPWRRSRQSIAGFLKSELFREGIDGEALEWAVSRIAKRHASRKIIMMISDGSPMDTATGLVNHDRYLDQHLQQVVHEVEKRPDIHLCGLGLGLDLSTYYSQCIAINMDEVLSNRELIGIAELLDRAV